MDLQNRMQWLLNGMQPGDYNSTLQQVPHYTHRALSTVLDVPMHQINVIRTFVGGGFGGKSILSRMKCVRQY